MFPMANTLYILKLLKLRNKFIGIHLSKSGENDVNITRSPCYILMVNLEIYRASSVFIPQVGEVQLSCNFTDEIQPIQKVEWKQNTVSFL